MSLANPVRDKHAFQSDLMKVCDAVIEGLDHGSGDDYFIGIDGKRPFGFSGNIALSILGDVLELEPDAPSEYSQAQEDYANAIIEQIIPTIQKVWKNHRPECE